MKKSRKPKKIDRLIGTLKNNMYLMALFVLVLIVFGVGGFTIYKNERAEEAQRSTNKNGSFWENTTYSPKPSIQKPQGNNSPSNNQSAQNTPKNSSGGNKNPCTQTPILFKTVFEDASWIAKGTQQVAWEGKNGYTQVCTMPSGEKTTSVVSPIDKRVLVGTYVAPTYSGSSGGTSSGSTTPTNTMSREQAQQMAFQNCQQYSNSSAFNQCISAYLRKYGY